jgi:hypothetical protein
VDAFLAADAAELTALCDLESPSDQEVLQTALQHVEPWRLAVWCREQNEKGVAPVTGLVLAKMEELRAALPDGVRPPSWGVATGAAARVRVQRWRRRWGGRFGVVRVVEPIDLQSLREKASLWGGGGQKVGTCIS